MPSSVILWVAVLGAAELLLRVCVLLYQMGHGGVKTLSYRTWVLLVALVPLAWFAYLIAGRAPAKK